MEFYATLKLDETVFQAVINKRRIFPNQNGTFKRKADLFRDAGDIDATLTEVLTLLGMDLRDQLLDTKVTTHLDDLSKRDGAFVVKEITATIEKNLNDRAATKRLRPALAKLLRWFRWCARYFSGAHSELHQRCRTFGSKDRQDRRYQLRRDD